MRMFGWKKPNDTREEIKAGFDPNGNIRQPIITFNGTTRELYNRVKVHAVDDAKHKFFWQLFRQIASNRIGRVLLYRLFIEIRRTDGNSKGGVAEMPSIHKNERNQYRSIRVGYCKKELVSMNNDSFFLQGDSFLITILLLMKKSGCCFQIMKKRKH
jgi:hypothetical protein